MKEVDLRNMLGKVSPKYAGISQPMVIYHSIAEFKKAVVSTNPIIIQDISGFQSYLKKYDLMSKDTYANVSSSNIWFATSEKFIPDYWTPKGVIMWKLKDNKLIPTDNCFIQLFYLYSGRNNYMVFTSSGVYNISITKWNLSAAVKDQFLREDGYNKSNMGGKMYEENLQKFLKKKKASVRDVRAFHCLFNPFSDTFLQPDKTLKRVFGGHIKAKDRMMFYETERFRKIFINEMRMLMPDLKTAFQTNIKDEEMVKMAVTMFNKAVDNGTTDDSIKVYDMIYQLRETERTVQPAFTKIGEKTPTAMLGGNNDKSKIPSDAIEVYDDAKITKVDESKKSNKKEEAVLSEEDLNELREETGALNDYVIPKPEITPKS